mmetsp:Transcript_36548/g.81350  ORF Transcript_36548/g.81350 Transcript_36548/m.81350 type:complete len:182 (+) Transcript_36548:129-674(+)
MGAGCSHEAPQHADAQQNALQSQKPASDNLTVVQSAGETQTKEAPNQAPSLFSRLGGEALVKEAADNLYGKIECDELLAPFFKGVDMYQQRRKMASYLRFAFGSGSDAMLRSLRDVHKHLFEHGLGSQHFDAMLNHLVETLEELHVPVELRMEVCTTMQASRPYFHANSQEQAQPADVKAP